ncbi:hypothetical protein J6590_064650 [Homalodisca vitripennis]|nr:hypothetical protein J6590_064650 [Homalodisca vitripennis]
MSRTSTHSNIHETYPRSISKIYVPKSSAERYKVGQGRRNQLVSKWSNDKVYDELSSFIAEFSYLTDRPVISDTQKPVLKSPTYNVYAVRKDEDDGNPFKRDSRSSNKSFRKNSSPRRKSVEWVDEVDSLIVHRRKRQNSPETPTTDTQREELRKSIPRTKRKYRNRPKSSGSRIGDKKSRSKSRMRRKVSQSRHKPRRRESKHEVHRIIPATRRRRRSRSKSLVKAMPFYAPWRKSKQVAVRPVERKREVRRKRSIKVVQVKKMIPHEAPTIVTLYPKTKTHEEFKPDFLADASLACKCFKCMKMYESLIKMSLPPPTLPLYYRPKIAAYPRLVHEPDWSYDCSPCALRPPDCGLIDSCQQFGDGYKSVVMKFNCIGQYLDSTITQYFHSILDRSIYY